MWVSDSQTFYFTAFTKLAGFKRMEIVEASDDEEDLACVECM